MKTESLFQVQALGHKLPAKLPTDIAGVQGLFTRITGRDDIVIHDAQWVSEWRCVFRLYTQYILWKLSNVRLGRTLERSLPHAIQTLHTVTVRLAGKA
jgi:hypothetical protein